MRNEKNSPSAPTGPDRKRSGEKVAPDVSRLTADETEPRAERGFVPVWMIALLVLLLYWGDMYIMDHGADVMGKTGSFPAHVFDPYKRHQELEDANPKSDADVARLKGKKAFELYCAPCHQSTGLGNPGNNIPPLAGSEWVSAKGAGRPIRVVLNSLRGPVSVKGVVFDNPGMPPWRGAISDEDIAFILSYVRGNKDWGNNAAPVTPEQVKAIRKLTEERADQWTAEELLQVPDSE